MCTKIASQICIFHALTNRYIASIYSLLTVFNIEGFNKWVGEKHAAATTTGIEFDLAFSFFEAKSNFDS